MSPSSLIIVAWAAFPEGIQPVVAPRSSAEEADTGMAVLVPDRQAVEQLDTPVDKVDTPVRKVGRLAAAADRLAVVAGNRAAAVVEKAGPRYSYFLCQKCQAWRP